MAPALAFLRFLGPLEISAMDAAPAFATSMGADRMVNMMHVADRANFGIFQRAPTGMTLRVGGQFQQSTGVAARVLTTTDGGSISVTPEASDDLNTFTGFVEVVGTKTADGALQATSVLPLLGDVDVGLWDEHVKMMHMPQLRHLFQSDGSSI